MANDMALKTSTKPETPKHYNSGAMQTIDKKEMVYKYLQDRITLAQADAIGNALKYFDRIGLKDDTGKDASKCADYLYRALNGRFLN